MITFNNEKKRGKAVYGIALATITFLSMVSVAARFRMFWSHPRYFVMPGSLFVIMIVVVLGSRWLKKPWLLELRHGIVLFGIGINNAVIKVALFVAYVGGIGLTAVLARLVGKKFLNVDIDHSAESWWEPLNLSLQDRERYYDMF